jgi:hypothetical protein
LKRTFVNPSYPAAGPTVEYVGHVGGLVGVVGLVGFGGTGPPVQVIVRFPAESTATALYVQELVPIVAVADIAGVARAIPTTIASVKRIFFIVF